MILGVPLILRSPKLSDSGACLLVAAQFGRLIESLNSDYNFTLKELPGLISNILMLVNLLPLAFSDLNTTL